MGVNWEVLQLHTVYKKLYFYIPKATVAKTVFVEQAKVSWSYA